MSIEVHQKNPKRLYGRRRNVQAKLLLFTLWAWFNQHQIPSLTGCIYFFCAIFCLFLYRFQKSEGETGVKSSLVRCQRGVAQKQNEFSFVPKSISPAPRALLDQALPLSFLGAAVRKKTGRTTSKICLRSPIVFKSL